MLPFKVEMTRDLPARAFLPATLSLARRAGQWQSGMTTPRVGLPREIVVELGLLQSADKYLPQPGSGAGYSPSEYTSPLISMLNGGGRSLEDTREIRADEGLREILPPTWLPTRMGF